MFARTRKQSRTGTRSIASRFEQLESRQALAVTAVLDGTTLRIALDAENDMASLAIEGARYVVSSPAGVVRSFVTNAVKAIVVEGSPAPGQGFEITGSPTTAVTGSLRVASSVEFTNIGVPIDTPGRVTVGSPQIEIAKNVRSSGPQSWGGAVRLLPPVSGGTTLVPLPADVNVTAWNSSAVSGDGRTLVVASQVPGTVAIVDPGGTKPALIIPLALPSSIAISHDGRHVYVAHDHVFVVDGGGYVSQPMVSVLDATTGAVTSTIEVPLQGFSRKIAVSPDGDRIYVSFRSTNGASQLIVIDVGPSELTLAGTVDLPFGRSYTVSDVAVSPDGARIYVADQGVNQGGGLSSFIYPSIAVVDRDALGVIGTIPLINLDFGGLQEFRLSQDGRTGYALGTYNRLSVIDTEGLVVSRELFPENFEPNLFPKSFHVAANGTSLLINYTYRSVADVDPISGRVRRVWPVSNAGQVFGTPDGAKVFVRAGASAVAFESPVSQSITLAGQSVTLSQAVDGPAGLLVRSPGATVFNAAAGASTPLARLVTDAGGTTRVQSVTTVGPQRYADNLIRLAGVYRVTAWHQSAFEALGRVQLMGDVSLRVMGGDVVFAGTIDAASRGGSRLSITSDGNGTNVALRGRVGGTNALAGLEFHGVTRVVSPVAVTLDGTSSQLQRDGLVIGAGVQAVRFTGRGSSIRNFQGGGVNVLGSLRNSLIRGFTIRNNVGHGVHFGLGDQAGTVVSGNTIAANGSRSTGIGDGISIEGFGATLSGNTIRGNGRAGISLEGAAARAIVLSNSIAANGPVGSGTPGIRFAAGADLGATPVIEAVRRRQGSLIVTLRLAGDPTQWFRLQLFASSGAASSAGPQGERLLANLRRVSGGAFVTVSLRTDRLKAGDVLTATATELSGTALVATSSFSEPAR